MTQEEKAQRYDEAVEIISDYYEKIKYSSFSSTLNDREVLEKAFPELAESEDEKIRKGLIQYFNKFSLDTFAGLDPKKILDWLENQGKQEIKEKPIWKHWKDGIAGNGEGKQIYLIKSGDSYTLSSCLGYECDYIELSELNRLLENQGEQKPVSQKELDDAYLKGINDAKNEIEKQYEANYQIRKDIATFIFNYRGDIKDRAKWMNYLGIKVSVVEKQDEQKPTDKVEPKFKVGDWVVNHNVVYHIDKNSGVYLTLSTLDGTALVYHISVLDSDYTHLWTIEDAKVGDVLASKDGGVILIFRNLDNSTSFSSYYNTREQGELGWSNNRFIPATKEQRNLLFQKIKEAGYEWDAKKKELKKIEKKPAWSEEDENGIRHSIDFLNHPDMIKAMPSVVECTINWLKSLKDRYTWKPSDEQMEYLAKAITTLGNEGDNKTSAILYELRAELKKLKEE